MGWIHRTLTSIRSSLQIWILFGEISLEIKSTLRCSASEGHQTNPFNACTNVEESSNVLAGYSGGALHRQGFSVTTTLRLILQPELELALFEEAAQILPPIQELYPLLVIKRDREAAKSVDGTCAFVAHFEADAPSSLLFGFEFG